MPSVLFVDDDPLLLRTFPRLFWRDAFAVVTAANATAALAIVAARAIDVVVSDHRMPGMLGAALLARLADSTPHIGRILLTGDTGIQGDAIPPHVAHEVLRKPASSSELRAAIARVLARPLASVA